MANSTAHKIRERLACSMTAASMLSMGYPNSPGIYTAVVSSGKQYEPRKKRSVSK